MNRGAKAPAGRGWARVATVSVLVPATCTALSWFLHHAADLHLFVIIYTLGVVWVAMRHGRLAAALATVLSTLAFDYFFEGPPFSLRVENWQNILVFAGMLAIAQVVASLVHQLREQNAMVEARRLETSHLYALSSALTQVADEAEVRQAAVRHLHRILGVEVALLPPGAPVPAGTTLQLKGRGGDLGALHLRSEAAALPRLEWLQALADQVALSLERARLAAAVQQAEMEAETERMRSNLLSAVSHDLRTPLATVSAAASTLASQGEEFPIEDRRSMAEMIHAESQRLEHLLVNVLEVSRLEGGPKVVRRERYALQDILGVVLNRLDAEGGEGIALDLPEDLPLVPMDGPLVQELLQNLLENALKHAPGAPVLVRARVEGGDLRVDVEDRGPGIPAGLQGRIFDKFVRGPNASADGGSGLGLAICRAIVAAHGGRIEAESHPLGGARFRFTLPILAEAGATR